jgi:hypothetical protein
MNQAKHYTAKDIERYHSGQLSAAEMHAMEKAGLDDPFLADALEGYTYTTTPAGDLSALQQKLQLRIGKEKKRPPLFYIGNNWMKIAALFILFAGGGWVVFQMLSTSNEKNIATVETINEKPPAITTPSTADTSRGYSDAQENSQTLTIQERPQQNVPQKNETAARQPVSPSASATARRSNPVHENNKDQQNNLQEVTALRQERVDDSFSSIGTTTAAREKELFKKSTSDTIKNFDVVMKPTEVAPDELIVMNNKAASPQARRRMQVMVDTLEPAEGWTNFDDYIASNIKTPDEFKTKPVKGEVELSFEVNKEGEPVNITVVKSLCEKCDEEAIRLLKEGPKWKKNKKKGKVKIKF